VCGTTGWLARKPEIEALTQRNNGSFFYASNYSLGVNIFFKLNEHLARMMSNFKAYDITLDEIHHTEKKDAPVEQPLPWQRVSCGTCQIRNNG
jgi:4-hydroxy-tetrahydrodipicolinate reductase